MNLGTRGHPTLVLPTKNKIIVGHDETLSVIANPFCSAKGLGTQFVLLECNYRILFKWVEFTIKERTGESS